MALARLGLRAARRRLLETLLVVLIVAAATAGLSVVRLASGYALMLASKAWVYEVGSMVVGVQGRLDPGKAAADVEGLPVEEYKVLEVAQTLGYYNGTPVSVTPVYNPEPGPPFSYTPLYEVGILRSIGYTDTGIALLEAASALTAAERPPPPSR